MGKKNKQCPLIDIPKFNENWNALQIAEYVQNSVKIMQDNTIVLETIILEQEIKILNQQSKIRDLTKQLETERLIYHG